MSTKHFAVIGHPIGHTMSPFIHAELFKLNGIEGDYAVVDIAPDCLDTEIPRLLQELDGFNVTIPYKSAVIPFLSGVEGVAEEYGSVNTVRCSDKSGRTTDPVGFVRALKAAEIELKGKVAVLGAGGVCRVFAGEAARAGCEVTFGVLDSDIPSAEAIVAGISKFHPDFRAEIVRINELSGAFDLLVNATPVGMYPKVGNMPVPREFLKPYLERMEKPDIEKDKALLVLGYSYEFARWADIKVYAEPDPMDGATVKRLLELYPDIGYVLVPEGREGMEWLGEKHEGEAVGGSRLYKVER